VTFLLQNPESALSGICPVAPGAPDPRLDVHPIGEPGELRALLVVQRDVVDDEQIPASGPSFAA
jgi:hypothetical protein